MKTVWKYYLRDDSLLFREFNGSVQYHILDGWQDSYIVGTEDLSNENRFKRITKREADKIKKL